MVLVSGMNLEKDTTNWYTLSVRVNFGREAPNTREMMKQIAKALEAAAEMQLYDNKKESVKTD